MKVRVLVKSFIDGGKRNPGDIIDMANPDGRVEIVKSVAAIAPGDASETAIPKVPSKKGKIATKAVTPFE